MRGASPTTAQGTSWTPPPAEVCFQSSQWGGSLSLRPGCSEMYDFALVGCKPETIPCILREMLQQIVVDPIRSRCTGFSLHDWPPQIPLSERLVVNFSVVWGEVNFVLLLLLFYGLECSTVVGRGGVVCKCCCMFISNIFRVGDGSTILPI